MTVYVDDMRRKLGRMIMCHMMADTEAEIHEMADAIELDRRHFQGDHYDVSLEYRARAVRRGAREITQREMVEVRRRYRKHILRKYGC